MFLIEFTGMFMIYLGIKISHALLQVLLVIDTKQKAVYIIHFSQRSWKHNYIKNVTNIIFGLLSHQITLSGANFIFTSEVHIDFYSTKLWNYVDGMLIIPSSMNILKLVKKYSRGYTHGHTDHASLSCRSLLNEECTERRCWLRALVHWLCAQGPPARVWAGRHVDT